VSAYPGTAVAAGHVEPCGRRIRGTVAAATVLDTDRAYYGFEWPSYPQWYVPADAVTAELRGTGETEQTPMGTAEWLDLVVGEVRPRAARRLTDAVDERLVGTVRFAWDAVDAWYEEDEQVFVHPRSPYTRVDALRSARPVRVELDGLVLADAPVSVMVFETGLPTRHYLDRTALRFEHLRWSATVTECPYKGRTTDYWSVVTPTGTHADLAWSYAFPTRQLLPVAGLVAFYDEKVDTYVGGELVPRPATHVA
jgi:uncharacterized protein (DUF427 family)